MQCLSVLSAPQVQVSFCSSSSDLNRASRGGSPVVFVRSRHNAITTHLVRERTSGKLMRAECCDPLFAGSLLRHLYGCRVMFWEKTGRGGEGRPKPRLLRGVTKSTGEEPVGLVTLNSHMFRVQLHCDCVESL